MRVYTLIVLACKGTMRRMDDEGRLTIEALASRAGTATTTVRMYQSKGLLPPPQRRGRIGYYGEGHLARLRLIAQLQEQGFSLASIKRLTEAWESGLELARSGIPVTEALDELEALQAAADSIAERFTRVFERNMWEPFVAAGLPAGQVRPLTESLQRLSTLAESVVDAVLRDALRRKAGEFLAQQAARLDKAEVRDELRPLARAAGLDM